MKPTIDRRAMLKLLGGAALGLAASAYASAESSDIDSAKRAGKSALCKPVIDGALWSVSPSSLGAMSDDQIREELNEQCKVGFNLVWLSYTASLIDIPGDPIMRLLDICATRHVQVIMDVSMSPTWYTTIDLKSELDICKKHIKAMSAKYGQHPAFYAWYIPHEVYVTWGYARTYQDGLYAGIVEACHSVDKRPVTLSPFFILDNRKIFGDFRYAEPEEYYAYWRHTLQKSHIDVIMLQDSGEHFSYVTMDQRRPFFEAMKRACDETRTRFWGNVETAEYVCPSIDEYIKLYGRRHHSTVAELPWRAVPIDRLQQKLELASQYCERIVCWGYYEFCKPTLNADAAKWYQDYQTYINKVKRI